VNLTNAALTFVMGFPDRAMDGSRGRTTSGAREAVREPAATETAGRQGGSHDAAGQLRPAASRTFGRAGRPAVAVRTGILQPHTLAWGALWFAVIVAFTAGVGVIQAAGAAGEMPPLVSSVAPPVIGNQVDEPSSAPAPPTVVDVRQAG
jgi:hypothetical protein